MLYLSLEEKDKGRAIRLAFIFYNLLFLFCMEQGPQIRLLRTFKTAPNSLGTLAIVWGEYLTTKKK